MILSKYAICGCKRFSGILSNLGLKTPLNKIPLLGDIFFLNVVPLNAIINMNKKVNKFLLAGDKFMAEMQLKKSEFTYSAYVPFTKKKKRIQKFEET